MAFFHLHGAYVVPLLSVIAMGIMAVAFGKAVNDLFADRRDSRR